MLVSMILLYWIKNIYSNSKLLTSSIDSTAFSSVYYPIFLLRALLYFSQKHECFSEYKVWRHDISFTEAMIDFESAEKILDIMCQMYVNKKHEGHK